MSACPTAFQRQLSVLSLLLALAAVAPGAAGAQVFNVRWVAASGPVGTAIAGSTPLAAFRAAQSRIKHYVGELVDGLVLDSPGTSPTPSWLRLVLVSAAVTTATVVPLGLLLWFLVIRLRLSAVSANHRWIDSTPVPVIVVRGSTALIINPAAAALLDLVDGSSLAAGSEIVSVIDPARRQQVIETLIPGPDEPATPRTVHLRRNTGELLEIEVTSGEAPLFGHGARQLVLHDNTAAVRAQRELHAALEEQGRLSGFQSELLETNAVAIIQIDRRFRARFWNRGAETISGYSRQEVSNTKVLNRLFPHRAARHEVLGVVRTLFNTGGKTAPSEAPMMSRDGRERIVLWQGAASPTPDGQMGAVIVAVDTTDQVLMRRELESARRLETVGRLSAGLAHNFNNLLQSIMGQAESLRVRGGTLDPAQRSSLAAIVAAAERGGELVGHLLSIGQTRDMTLVPIDLELTVRELEPLIRAVLPETISLELDLAAHHVVSGNAGKLGQVILNLVLNARDAMPDGGRITVGTSDEEVGVLLPGGPPAGRWTVLAVSDTGTGIDEVVCGRMFEPFFTTKGLAQGTGMGLASVQAIVGEHGGTIRVGSSKGRGTTFRIFLPLFAGTAVAGRAHLSGQSDAPAPGAGRGVLVVEDDPSVRQSLVQGLEAFGYRVIEADSGESAWALFTSSDVSCVVTDMVMPGISGKQLVERIRHTPAGADLPILVLTGYSHGAELDEARRLGCRILRKPLSLVALHRTLSGLLDGQQRAAGRP